MCPFFYYLTQCHERFFLQISRNVWQITSEETETIELWNSPEIAIFRRWRGKVCVHVFQRKEKKLCNFAEIWNWFDLYVSCSKNHVTAHAKCKVLQFVYNRMWLLWILWYDFRLLVIWKHHIKVRFLDIQQNRKWNRVCKHAHTNVIDLKLISWLFMK